MRIIIEFVLSLFLSWGITILAVFNLFRAQKYIRRLTNERDGYISGMNYNTNQLKELPDILYDTDGNTYMKYFTPQGFTYYQKNHIP